MNGKPKVLILIVNWNNFPDTSECLDSLDKLDYENYQVFIVDNGSSDGSNDLIKENFPGIILHESKENLGFAGGNNIGLEYALENEFQYILLLNNDIEIVKGNFLEVLVEELAEDDIIGAVGPKVMKPDGDPEVTILPYPTLPQTIKNVLGLNRLDLDIRQVADSLTGCCVLVRSEAVQVAGLLDENFFMYGEETEWFYRMRMNGFKIIYYPIESIIHKGGASSKKMDNKRIYIERRANVFYTLLKANRRLEALLTAVLMTLLLGFRIIGSAVLRGNKSKYRISMIYEMSRAFQERRKLIKRSVYNRYLDYG